MNAVAQGLWKSGGLDQVGSIKPVPTIAALRTLSSSTLDHPTLVYVAGYYEQGDGGEGFYEHDEADTTSSDNGATIIVDETSGYRYYRQWDRVNWLAAWGGIVPGVADIVPLLINVPKLAYCWGIPGAIYNVASIPTQYAVSNVFWRFAASIFNSTVAFADFDFTAVLFNWVYVPPITGTYAGGGGRADMTNAGVSSFEGMGIVSQGDNNAGVGVTFAQAIPANPGSARSTTSHATGRVHFEIKIGKIINGSITLGLSSSAYPLTQRLAFSSHALGIASNGALYIDHMGNDGPIATVDGFAEGDVYAFEFNFDTQLLFTCNATTNPTQWNASGTANPDTGVGGIPFSALAPSTQYFVTTELDPTSPVGQIVSGNFGASAFARAVSSTFSAWGAGTTFNPADQINLTFSNGNLTTTNNSAYFSTNDAEQYMTRPQKLNLGGWFCNVAIINPVHGFLMGHEYFLIKGGNIGTIWSGPGTDSGENIRFANGDTVLMVSDAFQLFNGNGKFTLDGGSIDYCHRAIFAAGSNVYVKNKYFENSSASTPNELIAVSGVGSMAIDDDSSFLNFNGGQQGDFFNFNGIGNPTVVTLDGPGVSDVNPFRQVMCGSQSGNANCFGGTRGGNNTSWFYTASINQNMQQNGNFATGDTSFFPGATGITIVSGTSLGQTFAASFASTATLPFQTMAVVPGDVIGISWLDLLTGTVNANLSAQAVFKSADGTTIGSPVVFTATANIQNFEATALSPKWPGTQRTGATRERFALLVPPGAATMNITISTAGQSGNYSLSSIVVGKRG